MLPIPPVADISRSQTLSRITASSHTIKMEGKVVWLRETRLGCGHGLYNMLKLSPILVSPILVRLYSS